MARNFLLPRFIDDRGGGGGGGPAESTAPRGREPFSTEKESTEEEGEGGQKRIRVEGTRFLNSFVRNRYPVPKSASLRDICTREGRRERKRERGVIRASTCKMEGWREGRKKKSEEKRRGRQSIRRVFSMRLERNYFISGRSIASTRSFHGKLPSTETLALPSKEEKRRYRVMVENEREREAILFRERAVPYAKDRTCAAI